ncbi:MAG: pantoate--beta-alanine ligase [Planctomycetota bacterium]
MSTPPTTTQPPVLIADGTQLREEVLQRRAAGQTVGLVPTMGALHAGHLSLVEAARRECDAVVVSVFVNPTQFGPGEDLDRYPRDLERDRRLLAEVGADVVFAPAAEAMYPPGSGTTVDAGPVAAAWEGADRPDHFRGVATIVLKLFNLAPAGRAYFGRKDYQQTVVVQQVVADLNVPIEVRVCPTVREPDGLAMSSRNAMLTQAQRPAALSLSRSLRLAGEMHAAGERDAGRVCAAMRRLMTDAGAHVQYAAALRPGGVEEVRTLDGGAVLVVAARVGQTRLIDNERIG